MRFAQVLSLLCAALLATVAAENTAPFVCTSPPEGDWLIEHFFPVGPGDDTLTRQARSIVTLQREAVPNVYTGSGSGITSNAVNPIVPEGLAFTFTLLGLFDTDTCAMSGTIFNLETGFVDTARWVYDGVKLSGPFFGFFNQSLVFDTLTRHDMHPLDVN